MTKIAGSGSGFVSQRRVNADPDQDPYQIVMSPQHLSLRLMKMYLILLSVGTIAARVGKCSARRAAARSSDCTTWRGGGRGGSARPATPSWSGWTGRRHRTAPPPQHSSSRRPGQILPTPWNTVPGETDRHTVRYRTDRKIQGFGSGSGFYQVSGSGSVFGIRIRQK
jgi:hypothetical protein